MTTKQHILIAVAVLFLISFLFFIIFSERGLVEVNALKIDRDVWMQNNQRLLRENYSLSVEIDRLENDPEYIANVARRELGMIGKDEFILKPQNSSNR